MHSLRKYLLFFIILTFSSASYAVLSLELNRGIASAIPIAIVPLGGPMGADLSQVIANDLQNSGRFKVFGKTQLTQFPDTVAKIPASYFRTLGSNYVMVGTIQSLGSEQYRINFQLADLFQNSEQVGAVLTKSFTVSTAQLRSVAHRISDLIYQQLTGTRGVFSTKLAYVVVQRAGAATAQYLLEVADQDGFNPKLLLRSREPIMSPAWSPDGRRIAYVSFENKHANIYIQDVITGSRQLLSDFPGINGAPAWSPDGRKLALVLSKSGAPNIYVMDIASLQLQPVTRDFYINTEPSWAPDGRSLIFTSNRSGSPQIYQVRFGSGEISRVTYDGDYNARASYTRDGKAIVMIHRVAGIYQIGLLNLETGVTRVLSTQARDSASPSVAPNNSMILYDTFTGERNVLSMVSADGRIELRLPARNGEAQDPAWSPFLG